RHLWDQDPRLHPRDFKGKQSKDAWSSCGSCHPDGLADGVTWIFGTGPRQTKPLDGMFSKQNPEDQRLLNWSAVRGSNTDFNNNSRATQGGCGFASDDFDPGQCFARGAMTGATLPSTTTASCRGAATRSTRKPCGSSQPCGRCTSRSLTTRAPDRQCLVNIVPLAMAGRSGRRARSSIVTTPRRSVRTWRPWIPASPGSPRRLR